ncbi:Protein kinase superfamily protein [Trifolium repens]|nr:Protein kinase superfamily protein [Trifolium repens]
MSCFSSAPAPPNPHSCFHTPKFGILKANATNTNSDWFQVLETMDGFMNVTTSTTSIVADMMAANELNSHMFIQLRYSKGITQHLNYVTFGWWLAFRDYGKSSAADYAKAAIPSQGALRGLAYMHDHDRLHQSLGPFSVSLKYVTSRHLVLFYDWGSPLNSEIK